MRRSQLCPLLLLALVAPLLLLVAPVRAAKLRGGHDAVFNQIDAIVQTLADVSGLPETHPVPYGRMSKGQLRRFLSKRIKKTLRPEEIKADELALKMFGLVPQEFDLKKSTIDLLTEQAAAFYDYDEKKLFLLEEASFSAEAETLAHELSHALADQHFDLQKYMDDTSQDDDANLARTAVVEGQASWLMLAYALKQSGQPDVPTRAMLENAFQSDSGGSMANYPVLKASPLYIQQSLLFPYSEGTLFFDSVYRKDGKKAFAEVFRDPPVDTGQILHPERYFEHEKATAPTLPKLRVAMGAQRISEGNVGEFDHELLLWQYFDEQRAKSLAPHLKGGDFEILGAGPERKPLLVYVSEWDTPENAARFFTAYQHVLESKWKGCDPTTRNATLFAGDGDNGYFATHLSGVTVTSVEGIQQQSDWSALKSQFEPAAIAHSASGRSDSLFLH